MATVESTPISPSAALAITTSDDGPRMGKDTTEVFIPVNNDMVKTCKKCEIEKAVEEFHKDASKKDGYAGYCKKCNNARNAAWKVANTDKVKAGKAAWAAANPEKMKEYRSAWYSANKQLSDARSAAWRAENPDKRKTICANYYSSNKEKILSSQADYRSAFPEKRKAACSAWREENQENLKASRAAYYALNYEKISAKKSSYRAAHPEIRKAYIEANREKINTHGRNRRARKRDATGKHTAADIQNLLLLQKKKCAICKISISKGYHVDHVIPLAKGGSNDYRNIQLLCPTCNIKKNAQDPVKFMQSRGMLI